MAKEPTVSPASMANLPAISLSGEFAGNVMIVPTTNSSMLLGTATYEADRQSTLVPYVEITIAGKKFSDLTQETIDSENYDTLFSQILPLENCLFFAWDILRDIQIGCSDLARLSGNSLALEPARLRLAADFATKLRTQAELCHAAIEGLLKAAEAIDSSPKSP